MISAIVPTFRESTTAPDVIGRLQTQGIGETIVVDDSPTLSTARAIQDAHPETTVIHRDGDGLGSAVIRGFAAAEGSTYLVCDGDGQHPADAAARIAQKVKTGDCELCLGTRHSDGGEVADSWPLNRRIISTGADVLARASLPPARGLSDPMTGLFAVEAGIVDAVLPRLRPSGYKIILELLSRCAITDITEVGYRFGMTESESNLGPCEYFRYLRHLARLSVPSRQEPTAAERVLDGAEVAASGTD